MAPVLWSMAPTAGELLGCVDEAPDGAVDGAADGPPEALHATSAIAMAGVTTRDAMRRERCDMPAGRGARRAGSKPLLSGIGRDFVLIGASLARSGLVRHGERG